MLNNRILIADDEPDFTEIIGAVAEDIGFEVITVHEGNEVVSRASAVDPGVIILDLRMPGTDGVEVLKQLAEMACTAQILLISGLGQRTLNSVELVGKERKLNVIGSLTKPMTPDEIEETLTPLLGTVEEKSAVEITADQDAFSSFGLQTLFLPHVWLNDDAQTTQRILLEGRWILDNKEEVSGKQLQSWSHENGFSKGLTDLVLRDAMFSFNALSKESDQLEFVLPFIPELLQDEEIADHLAEVFMRSRFPAERIIVETDEQGIHRYQSTAVEVLSRMRIKGFRIAMITETNSDELLSMIDKLPMDEIIMDMSLLNRSQKLNSDMELEFAYSSLNSMAKRMGIQTCAHNIDSTELLEFVKRCNFDQARGRAITGPHSIAKLEDYLAGTLD